MARTTATNDLGVTAARGRRFTGPAARWLFGLALALALAGCAPNLAPPGPGAPADAPKIDSQAIVTDDGAVLPLRAWLPPSNPAPAVKAVILALHGFNDYSNAFDRPGAWWAQRGIATYAYDQRGFGEAPHRGLWAGTERLAADVADAVDALSRRHPRLPVYLLGTSMGGAVAVAAMTGPEPPEVDGVILAAPAVWARSTMPAYQRAALWLGATFLPWMTVSGAELDILASDNIEMLRALGRDPLFIKETRVDAVAGLTDLMDTALAAAPHLEGPALILYGEKDEVIPWGPTRTFWTRLPKAGGGPDIRLALYRDGWHMLLRDLQAEVVWRDIAHWIEKPNAPLPSAAERHAARALADPDFEPERRER
ncbi:MAG: alpha/beta hydrolase [Rhodovibrionaceae bacterium]|nr:alpha/beta hydrolase [Rhodovibrionaceae bacterium]